MAASTGTLTPWLIYLTALLEATRLAIDIPARSALIATAVPVADLHSAQSLSSTVFSASALIGPAVGGLLLTTTGPAWVFAINGVSCLLALAAFRGLPRAGREHRPAGRLGDGLRFALRHRTLLSLQSVLFTTGTLIIGVETLLPVLDATHWHSGPTGYGLVRMAPGLAALVAGVVLARGRAPATAGRAIAISVTVTAAALTVVPISPGTATAFIALTAGSLAASAAQVHTLTRLQQLTPDELRGAVSGLTAMTMSGFAGIGAATMAIAAAGTGPTPVVAVVAAAAAITGLIAASTGPSRLGELAGRVRSPTTGRPEPPA